MAEDARRTAVGEGVGERRRLEGAYSSDGVDLTVIRWMLSLTPLERLQAAQDLIDTAASFKRGDEA